MQSVGELGIAFFCVFAVVAPTTTVTATATAAAAAATTFTAAAPTTTLSAEESNTVATIKFDESSKITTFVPPPSVTKPAVTTSKKVARYEGDQVLRVFTVNSKHRKKIKEIERENREY